MSDVDDQQAEPSPASIPGNWAVPAQLSAAAAGVTTPPRTRDPEQTPGHPMLWLALLVVTAALAYLTTVGFLAADAPIPDLPLLDVLDLPTEPAPPAGLNPPPQDPAGEAAAGAVPAADPSFPTLPASGARKTPPAATAPKVDPPPAAGEPPASEARPPIAGARDDGARDDGAQSDGAGMKMLPVRKKAKSLVRRAERRLKLKNYAGARKLIEHALRLDPSQARAHRARAVICAHRGDAACAREAYQTYLKLAPDAPDAPSVREILELGK